MRYNKQPTDITTQLVMLKQRGLIVSDENTALKQLASISYFRLASYWKVFETDEDTHQFAIHASRVEDVGSRFLRQSLEVVCQHERCGGKETGCKECWSATIHLSGKLDAQSHRPSQLLCPSCPCMEPPLSCHAAVAKAIAAYMG